MRLARGILIALGVGLTAIGGIVLLVDVPPERYLGIATWVGAAIVLHDGVVAPVVVAVGLGAARADRRLGRGPVAVVQGAMLVGAILTAIALPALIASLRGNANPTILVGSYASSLAVAWALVAITVAVAAVAGVRRASPSSARAARRN
ncbi:hypothetical protein [Agromyces salentinus]|uniref:Major facilitator superfamily (MFS) profile domain-containing protein n=1 Tax=Agromyces salentinus TaxID=269421 RepID=A0ABP4YZG7_9MICO|nr:hypothetical protein [Agromyces salentinus]